MYTSTTAIQLYRKLVKLGMSHNKAVLYAAHHFQVDEVQLDLQARNHSKRA